MQNNINEKILSIPPYISSSWQNISSLSRDENDTSILLVTLKSESVIKIPNLDEETMDKVFTSHAQSLEVNNNTNSKVQQKAGSLASGFLTPENLSGFAFPLKLGNNLEGLGAAMQHNPQQSNSPDLPRDVLEKIGSIAKIVSGDESVAFPKPEPHCNCIHCQIARAITQGVPEEQLEEEITEEDLKFRSWDITKSGDKLYTVHNPLNPKEQYSVYLGDPIGCTCGEKTCEHIKAVLNS